MEHRKSGVISIKHSRDNITNRISPLTVRFLPVTATCGRSQVENKLNIRSHRDSNSYRLPVAVALKFILHVDQSFIKGHRNSKSGVISMIEAF